MSNSNQKVSPHWAGFRRLWIIVAVLLFLFLLITWLLGYGPGGNKCAVPPTIVEKIVEKPVEVEKIVEVEKVVEKIVNVEKLISAPDTQAPHLALKGSPIVNMVEGEKYIDAGIIAVDNIDADVEVRLSGKVDTDTTGEYILTYTASDKAGNQSSKTRKVIVEAPAPVIVVDTTAPVVTLLGSDVITLTEGESFTDDGATALDNVDGEISVTVTGKVNTERLGDYYLVYLATDKAGNTSRVTRKVTVKAKPVVDTVAPEVSLFGPSVMTVVEGESFPDPGAIAVDSIDGEVKVTVTGGIKSNTPGDYYFTYAATDKSGNTSRATRKVVVEALPVIDEKAPTISLIGSALTKIVMGNTYVDPGATAVDDVDGDVDVYISGSYDTNKAGSYTLIYNAADKAGNTSSLKREVIVEAPLPVAKLYFRSGSARSPADKKSTLAPVIAYLRKNDSSKAVLSGYHDPSGNLAFNKQLASNRAKAVQALLKRYGISSDRIIVDQPTQTTGTGAPSEARRVEISINR